MQVSISSISAPSMLHCNFPPCSPMECPVDNLLHTHRTNSGTRHSELANWVPLPSPGDPPPAGGLAVCPFPFSKQRPHHSISPECENPCKRVQRLLYAAHEKSHFPHLLRQGPLTVQWSSSGKSPPPGSSKTITNLLRTG